MIHLACQVGNVAGVKAVLYWTNSQKAHESALPDGRWPIHVACEHGHQPVVELLLSHYEASCKDNTVDSTPQPPKGGLVHATNYVNKWTPLHYACASGNVGLVQYLIEQRGANVFKTSREPYHFTALHVAAKAGCRSVVEYLVQQAGASLNGHSPEDAQNPYNRSSRNPLDLACQQGHVEVAMFLLERGATVTAQTLHLGADHGCVLLRPLIKQLPVNPDSSKLLRSRQNGHTLLDYDWLDERGLLQASGWEEIGRNHRHWRSWNLLALLLHRLYYCEEKASVGASVPPLYQLSNQVDAKVRVRRRKTQVRPGVNGEATGRSDSSSAGNASAAEMDGSTTGSDSSSEALVQESPTAASRSEDVDHVEYEEVEETVEFAVTQAKDFCWMLHAAASLPRCPADVLTLLTRLFPAQLRAKRRGLTPLLLACRQKTHNEAVIATLLEGDPRAAGVRENTVLGRLPLTHALLHQQPIRVVALLMRTYPPALLELEGSCANALQLTALHADLGTLFWLLRSSPAIIDDLSRAWCRHESSRLRLT